MLVLSRRAGESILIGDDITIMVVEVSAGGHIVRLGIEAPREVQVDRLEVRKNREAGLPPPGKETR